MSYLQLPSGIPNFSKSVISFWFRVPKQSLLTVAEKAQVHFDADEELRKTEGYPSGYVYPRLNGVLPLLTFGPMFEGYQIKQVDGEPMTYTRSSANYVSGVYHIYSTDTYETTDGLHYVAFSQVLSNPSFIGVRSIFVYDDDGNPTDVLNTALLVRIQMSDHGSGSWVDIRTQYDFGDGVRLTSSTGGGVAQDTAWSPGFNSCMQDHVYPGGEIIDTHTLIDETEIWARQYGPESFTGDFTVKDDNGNGITIDPDTWHHVLVSFDLGHSMTGTGSRYVFDQPDCTVGSGYPDRITESEEVVNQIDDPCRMWIALDDFNDFSVGGGSPDNTNGLGSNDITTYTCSSASTSIIAGTIHQKVWELTGQVRINYNDTSYGIPRYGYSPGPIPSAGFALGIPCTAQLLDSVYQIEMAEFQMWTGVTLDTGIESNRRVFVDSEGYPVPPVGQPPSEQHPAGLPPPAEVLLGKRPEVLLHGTGNWKDGKNTGSLGIQFDNEGNPVVIPAGQFDPTGTINSYKPDPSLHGPQTPPPKPPTGPVRLTKPVNARL
jgi:hypothetical protein